MTSQPDEPTEAAEEFECMRDDCSLAIRAPDTILCQGHFDEQVNRLAEAATEPTCETCGDEREICRYENHRVHGTCDRRPCPDCRPTEPTNEAETLFTGPPHPEERYPFTPTEAPAPAAPLALEALRTILELIGIDDSEAAWRDATTVGWEAVAAARAHGGAAGEALEAAVKRMYRFLTVGAALTGKEHALDDFKLIHDALIAAARAPGPVGGEAELRRLLHGVLWHQQNHSMPLDECPSARCYPIAVEVAAAAPAEPGGG